MKHKHLFGILCGALLFLQCFTGVQAASDPLLGEAEQAFKEKRFHAAEDLLTAEIAKNPTNQEAHLLLARTYVQLLDSKAAEREYANCMKCNPFSATGRLAHNESINTAGRTASDKAAPTDDVNTVSRSVDAINREANELKGSYGTASNTMTPAYYNPAASYRGGRGAAASVSGQAFNPYAVPTNMRQSMGIQAGAGYQPAMNYRPPMPQASMGYQPPMPQASMGYQPNMGSPMGMGPGMGLQPGMQPGMGSQAVSMPPSYPTRNSRYGRQTSFANMSASYDPNQQSWSYRSSDYQVQQSRRQQAEAQSSAYTQDSANNLERLMAEKQNTGASNPKLRALGTNLFVRYYGSHDQDGSTAGAPPADPVQELKAKELKFSDMK